MARTDQDYVQIEIIHIKMQKKKKCIKTYFKPVTEIVQPSPVPLHIHRQFPNTTENNEQKQEADAKM